MQMEQWQDAASRQVELLTHRLNELLSRGLQLLRSELGVDLGLKPELIPPWVILLAACTGLVLMVVLWASVCRGLFKKRPAHSPVDDGIEVTRGVSKPVKPEDPKKKKKKAEKAPQPNGRAVAEPQEEEEVIVSEETVPHHQPTTAEVKAEKVAEVKKSKKKAKQAARETKSVTADGKEPEEGTWETKVSNKERREQRKKDKSSSDGSASPGGGDTPVSNPPEQPKAPAAPISANQKKKKGESTKVKTEKMEAVVSKVNSREVAAEIAGVTDMAVNVPAHIVSQKSGPWTNSREPVSLWRTEIDDSWTVIDRGMPATELKLSFAGLGVGAAEPHAVSDLPWLSQPRVDEGWSGLNGGSADPSSDWNAPSEAWGNFEEPTPELAPAQEKTLPEPIKVNLLVDDEDEKDKGETASDGAAKTKKKKKKKKKAAEEGGATDQGEEPEKEATPAASVKKHPPLQENPAATQPVKAAAAAEARVERPVKGNVSPKPPVTQVPQKPTDGETTAKQNSLPAPAQQKKPEESQAPKPAKKKKARRET
ncbi:protein LYRIC isoform X1 [Paralichthys olivaceus]|uniref:protein LYRIC isoform X1 n=1 Tax=Paralichthys olivaceus TaxID=8255 RepID=UPI00375221E4